MLELGTLNKNSVIVIAGPTASGKSALALELALKYGGEIINADSMQIYRGLPVISAVPSEKDKKKVLHHLYEIYDPTVRGTVVDWLALAVGKIKDVWAKGKIPVVTGGTGLYIDNLINGTTPIPEPSAEIRQQILSLQSQLGNEDFYKKLQQEDPAGAAQLSPNDTTRVRRAYEILQQTGISVAEWHKKPMIKKIPEAEFKVISLLPVTKELDQRCYERFEQMIKNGAVEEVKQLLTLQLDKTLPAMKMLGVPELAGYLQGMCSLAEAIEAAQLHTRQYAKRQKTWFRNKLKADIVLTDVFVFS